MNLINKKNLLVAFAFGLIGFLVIISGIYLIIPGTSILTDPREIFVTIGSALTGPVGGIIVGVTSSLYDPLPGMQLYVIIQHLVGGLLLGLFYKKLVYEKSSMPFFVIRWIILVFSYYYIFYASVFTGTYFIDRELFRILVHGDYSFFDSLIYIYKSIFPEFLFTSVFTSLIFIALPNRYRKPLWGKNLNMPTNSKFYLFGKEVFNSSGFKNILPVRLIIWFLLLAILPILLIGISIKNDVLDSVLKHEANYRHSLTQSYKEKFFELPRPELIKQLKEAQTAVNGDMFIMNREGIYALAEDSIKERSKVEIDYNPSLVEQILQMRNGSIIDQKNYRAFGFSTYHGKMHDLTIVSVSDKNAILDIASRLEKDIYNKLVLGLAVISLFLILIIWLLIKTPLSRFGEIISQFSSGNKEARVPTDEMNDEIKLLAESFNQMADNIVETNQSLEKEIIGHKEAERKLKETEERWKFALEGAGDGVWDWNADTNKVYFSSNWKKMLGYSDYEISDSLDEWSSRVHPDDKEKCLSDLQKYFDGETSLYVNEHRMLCKDGSYKWILDRGKIVERKSDGKPLRVIGTHTDIDYQKKIIEELEKKNIFIQTILDNLPIGLATNELDSGEANYINKKFLEIYGWSENIVKNVSSFFEHVYPDPDYRNEIATRIMNDINSGDPERMKWDNIKVTTERGEEKFVSAVNIPIPEQNIMVSTVRDVTEQFIAQQKVLTQNKSMATLLETSSLVASTLELDVVLQNIIDSIVKLIELDSGAIYLVKDTEIYLAASNPPLPPDIPEVFRHASLKNHLQISKCINEKEPVNIYDITKIELTPEEKLVVETTNFKSLLYLPLITGEEIHAVLIVGTIGRERSLSDSEVEMCKTFSNISALAISNAKLYQKSLDNITMLEQEVMERIKVENALKASEDKFFKAFKINPDAININRLTDGVYLEANKGFSRMTGYAYNEIIGKSSLEINIWHDPLERNSLISQLKEHGQVDNFEANFRMKDGTIKIGLMSASIIEIGGEKCILSITRDITERKNAEIELKENQRRLAEANQLLQHVLDTVPSRIFWKDKNSILLGCNKPFTLDAGFDSPEQMIGLSDYEMGWKDQADLYRADDQNVMNSGVPKLNYEEPQTTPSGNTIWLKTSKVPLRDVDGNIMGVLGTYEDITEKKIAEQAIKESEERYKALFNNNHSVMLLINPTSGQIMDANPAACKYYGWSRSEMINKTIMEINTLTPEEINKEMELARTQQRNRFLFRHRLANDEIRDVEVFSGSVVINSETLLYSIIHDITEQKRAEQALLESEEKYRYMFAKNPQPMWIYDLETLKFLEVNDAAIDHYGYCKDDFLNMTLKDIRPEEDIPALLKDVELTKIEFNPSGEWRHRKKDGSIIDVEITSHSVTFNGRNARHVLIKDVTERKLFEKRITDSLKEKEVLLKEVHHRVKNNFQVIISLLSLQSELINDPQILQYFVESKNRIKSMALTHELLYRQTNFESIDVRHYIDSLVDYLKRSYPESHASIKIIPDVDEISIDIDTIIPCGLIINELISNCMKHAFPGGKNGEITISFKKSQDNFFNLTVKDNGIGISKEMDMENLKSLGMMLVNTLTRQLGGEMNIKSSEFGSEFVIKFPAVLL